MMNTITESSFDDGINAAESAKHWNGSSSKKENKTKIRFSLLRRALPDRTKDTSTKTTTLERIKQDSKTKSSSSLPSESRQSANSNLRSHLSTNDIIANQELDSAHSEADAAEMKPMGCSISPYVNFYDSSSENLNESNEKLLLASTKKAISSLNMEHLDDDDDNDEISAIKSREINSNESSPNLIAKSKYNKTRKHVNFPLFQATFIDNPIFSKFNKTTSDNNKRLSSNSGKANKNDPTNNHELVELKKNENLKQKFQKKNQEEKPSALKYKKGSFDFGIGAKLVAHNSKENKLSRAKLAVNDDINLENDKKKKLAISMNNLTTTQNASNKNKMTIDYTKANSLIADRAAKENLLDVKEMSKIKSSSFNCIDLQDFNQDDDKDDEVNLFKTAYFKKEVPKEAVKTKLITKVRYYKENPSEDLDLDEKFKDLIDDNELEKSDFELIDSEPIITKTTTTTTSDSPSPDSNNNATTTTTTTTVTKTLIKVNDVAKKKNMSKRRNTISTIAISKSNSITTGVLSLKNDKKLEKMMASEISEVNRMDIFEIVAEPNIDLLKKKIIVNPESVNSLNEFDYTPLDLALMLNYESAIKILLSNEAVENSKLVEWSDRYQKACKYLTQIDQELRVFLRNFDITTLTIAQISEYENKLKLFDTKLKMLKKIKSNYEQTDCPDEVTNILLQVYGPNSLIVSFDGPTKNTEMFTIKYLIEWSKNPNFEPLDGQTVITFIENSKQNKQFIINSLTTNQVYFVRISCANIKGYGPYCLSHPPYATPSYWREGLTIKERQLTQLKKLKELNDLIAISKSNSEFVMANDLNHLQKFSKPKLGIKKNLKTLFTMAMTSNTASNSFTYIKGNGANAKFVKQLKKCSAYLVSVVYDDDKVLTTNDDNLPIVEIDENYSTQTLNTDLQFLVKLSFNWDDIDNYKNLIEQTINASSLRFRYLLISAIKHIQNLLEFNNLGRVYYQCLKHPNGSVFFITVSNLKTSNLVTSTQSLKLNEIEKLYYKINNYKTHPKNAPLEDDDCFLIRHFKSIKEFDQSSDNKLKKGLYVAYLKIQSSFELVKVMVSSQMPNSLPCFKIRDNPNVSKEEWKFIKSIKSYTNNLGTYFELEKFNFLFLISLVDAVYKLCNQIELKEDEIDGLRLMTKDLIEVNENITLILISPPAEQICVMPNLDDSNLIKNSSSSSLKLLENDSQSLSIKYKRSFNSNIFHKQNPFIYLPVQLFEAVHLNAYDLEFIKTYVQASIKLEIEFLASNQFNREAFSNEEINSSKRILNLVSKYQKLLEELWKDSRWIVEAINTAREKFQSQSQMSTISLAEIKQFLGNVRSNKHAIKFKNCCRCFLNNFEADEASVESSCAKKDIYNQISKLPAQQSSKNRIKLFNFVCNCNNKNEPESSLGGKMIKSKLRKMTNQNSFNCHHIDSIMIDDDDVDIDIVSLINNSYKNNKFKPDSTELAENQDSLAENSVSLCDDCIKNDHKAGSDTNANTSLSSESSLSSSSKKSVLIKNSRSNSLKDYSKKEDSPKTDITQQEKKRNPNSGTNLVSKLYISAPTTPTSPSFSLNESISKFNLIGNKIDLNDDEADLANGKCSSIISVDSGNSSSKGDLNLVIITDDSKKIELNSADLSSSSCCSASDSVITTSSTQSVTSVGSSSSQANFCSRNILVHVDFQTELKIDMNFECTINNQTSTKDVIYHILKKLNSFISVFNQMNSGKHVSGQRSKAGLLGLARECASPNDSVKLLDENFSLYYLVVVLLDSREKVLMSNFILSSLKEPWIKGNFFIRKKKF